MTSSKIKEPNANQIPNTAAFTKPKENKDKIF